MIRNPAGYVSPDRVNGVEAALCFCEYIWGMLEKLAIVAGIHWGVEIYMVVYIVGAKGLSPLFSKLMAHF